MATPAPGLAAWFGYAMPARLAVPDPRAPEGLYEIDTVGDLHPIRWPITQNGCASTGRIVAYSWTIDGTSVGSPKVCDDFVPPFAAEGSFSPSLVVEDAASDTGSTTVDVFVHDHLFFDMGDSCGALHPDVDGHGASAAAIAASVGR